MTVHTLKTWPAPFIEIAAGRKTFEWRREDDRRFEPGDVLRLAEWDPVTERITSRGVTFRAGFILRAPDFDVPHGFAIVSLLQPEQTFRAWLFDRHDDSTTARLADAVEYVVWSWETSDQLHELAHHLDIGVTEVDGRPICDVLNDARQEYELWLDARRPGGAA